jgi:hypothetical protein
VPNDRFDVGFVEATNPTLSEAESVADDYRAAGSSRKVPPESDPEATRYPYLISRSLTDSKVCGSSR